MINEGQLYHPLQPTGFRLVHHLSYLFYFERVRVRLLRSVTLPPTSTADRLKKKKGTPEMVERIRVFSFYNN